ncbi:MAG: stage II sporulation protein M [Gammaproteobacteria bacterium]|nr:hypothetical protein [Gammaproteobacteria bacterium]
MTPLQFEARYQADWEELQRLLHRLQRHERVPEPVSAERLASLYRRACEQLALARARAYPTHIIERLNQLTSDAHQVIYQQRELGLGRLRRLIGRDFPCVVRAHSAYVWLATAVFAVPMVTLGLLVYLNPDLILSIVDPRTAAAFEAMYSDTAKSIGRLDNAERDWAMFGFYIRHNIGIGFQCFASGLFAGVGTLFFLAFNGAYIGGIAGYLTERGLSSTFYSFVVTHGAFELTAIVLTGAAGLRLGHALVAPGPRTRREALILAAREAIVIVYGAVGLFLIAAAIEAFWSSARWIPLPLKYGVAACCWIGVLGYLWRQGRHAR